MAYADNQAYANDKPGFIGIEVLTTQPKITTERENKQNSEFGELGSTFVSKDLNNMNKFSTYKPEKGYSQKTEIRLRNYDRQKIILSSKDQEYLITDTDEYNRYSTDHTKQYKNINPARQISEASNQNQTVSISKTALVNSKVNHTEYTYHDMKTNTDYTFISMHTGNNTILRKSHIFLKYDEQKTDTFQSKHSKDHSKGSLDIRLKGNKINEDTDDSKNVDFNKPFTNKLNNNVDITNESEQLEHMYSKYTPVTEGIQDVNKNIIIDENHTTNDLLNDGKNFEDLRGGTYFHS